MARVTLSVRMPQGFDAALWPTLNEKLMKLLVGRYELQPDDDESCNWQLWDFLTEHEVKDIAVFIFGNDMPATVEMVKRLRIIGDGDCPSCGSNDREEITGGYKPAENDFGGFEVLGWRCRRCKHEDYR
jgi:hypothetical protein